MQDNEHKRLVSTDLTQPTKPPTYFVCVTRIKNPRVPLPFSGWGAVVSTNREEAIHGALKDAAGIQGIGDKGPGVSIFLGQLTEELEQVEIKGHKLPV